MGLIKVKERNGGFTLLEFIAILTILGIIMTIAASRIFFTSPVELESQIEKIKSHLRYAQMRSMNDDFIWGINFTASQYWLFRDGTIASKVILPGEDSDIIDLPSGANSPKTISFDSWGRPSESAIGSPLAEEDIPLTIGGESDAIITSKKTGYVQ
jgi:Tfp pilus assembly protein FimT